MFSYLVLHPYIHYPRAGKTSYFTGYRFLARVGISEFFLGTTTRKIITHPNLSHTNSVSTILAYISRFISLKKIKKLFL